MTTFKGRFYGGRNAAAIPVEVQVTRTGVMSIKGTGIDLSCPVTLARFSDRLGNTRRFITLPEGATVETANNEAADEVCRRFHTGRRVSWVHQLERSWPYVLIALLSTAAAIWAGINFGVPAAARSVANQLPPEIETRLGEEALAAMDERLLQPTHLGPAQQEHLRRLYESLGKEASRLELRSAAIVGANAFALPSGITVVTDELVELARDDDEILAVMAHELGHIHYRHIMRTIIQNSATALILAVLIGDLSSIAGLSATIPTVLMEAHYSREFEFEADAFAVQRLVQMGKDPAALSRILQRLSDEHDSGDANPLWQYLSTHPDTDERVEAIRALGAELNRS